MIFIIFVFNCHLNRKNQGIGQLEYFKYFRMVAKLFPQENWLVQKNVFSMITPQFEIRQFSNPKCNTFTETHIKLNTLSCYNILLQKLSILKSTLNFASFEYKGMLLGATFRI